MSFQKAVSPDNAADKKVKWIVGVINPDAVKLYSDEACNAEIDTDATETDDARRMKKNCVSGKFVERFAEETGY